MKTTSALSRKLKSSKGFTLYEVMAVITIMSLLASLSVSSLKSLISSNHLNQAVELVTRSTVVARQMAMGGGYRVAMIVSDSVSDQGVLMLKGLPDSNGTLQWQLASPWKTLPHGIQTDVFARNGSPSFYSATSAGGPISGTLPLKLNGNDISTYSYIVFRPDGTVDAPENAPSLGMKRLNKENTDDDYIILVQENTGRSKVIEP